MNAPILHYHQARRRARLNDLQAEVLCRIADAPVSLTRLADAVATSTANMTHVAHYLEQRGLARRVFAPHDRRRQLLTISPEGEEIAAGFAWSDDKTVLNPLRQP